MEQLQDHVNQVQRIVTAISDGAEASVINRHQCKRLASLCKEIGGFFKQLGEQPELPKSWFNEFIHLLEKVKILVLQYSSAQWFELLFTRGNNQEAFKEIHCELEPYMTSLMELPETDVHLKRCFDEEEMKSFFKEDVIEDHAEMLVKLEELGKSVPMATMKLNQENPTQVGEAKQSEEELPFNMQIDPWEIDIAKEIGKGAYGLVHEVYWFGCKLAGKIVQTGDINVLQKEVGILSNLRHPHIVQLVGFSIANGYSMILMERMDGDLHHLIEQRDSPPFPNHIAIDIIFQIATGMAYLHNRGVFHGDLKASNVLVIHRGGHIEVKIADFGVSQSVQLTRQHGIRLQKDGVYSNSSFSGTVGTTRWRAPEVFPLQVSKKIPKDIIEDKALKDREKFALHYNQGMSNNLSPHDGDTNESSLKKPTYTAKADVYSFGMTCYEILTGKTPFSGLQLSAIYGKVMAGERPKLPNHIDTRLSSLIQMCWDTDAEKRPMFSEICSHLQTIKVSKVKLISGLHNSTITQAPRRIKQLVGNSTSKICCLIKCSSNLEESS